MKNYILLLFATALFQVNAQYYNEENVTSTSISTSSTSINIEDNSALVKDKEILTEGEGITYKGEGIYKIQQSGRSDLSSYKKQVKNAVAKIISFSEGYNVDYEIMSEERIKLPVQWGVPRTIITFKLKNKDGSPFISKDEAKKSLIELKEFLDLGIITKEEFDKKAESLKSTILK